MRQGVDDGDVGVDFDGLVVQERWTVAPLADGSESGWDQERVSGNYFQGLNRAVGGDDGVKFDATLTVELNGQRRIDRLDTMDEHGSLDEAADAAPFYGERAGAGGLWGFSTRVRWCQAARNTEARRETGNFGTGWLAGVTNGAEVARDNGVGD